MRPHDISIQLFRPYNRDPIPQRKECDSSMTWLPLTLLVSLIILIEYVSIRTDLGTRIRRETRPEFAEIMDSIVRMEQAGLQIRPTFLHTENPRNGRKVLLIQSCVFWGLITTAALLTLASNGPWWVPALVAASLLALQRIGAPKSNRMRFRNASQANHRYPRWAMNTVSISILLTGLLMLAWGVDPRMPQDQIGIHLATALGGIALMYVSIVMTKLTDRLGFLTQATPRFGEDATKGDVLLLRSFDDDGIRIRAMDIRLGTLNLLLGNRVRFEEYVATAVAQDSDLIAIGKPGESLPSLGAARTYFADDEWQSAIDTTVRRVGAVIMLTAGTSGFEWELNLLRQTGYLAKTLILVPPISADDEIERVQDLFSRLGISTLDRIQDDSWNDWVFTFVFCLTGISFTEDGQPIYYISMGRDWAAYAATIFTALGHIAGKIPAPRPGEIEGFVKRLRATVQ